MSPKIASSNCCDRLLRERSMRRWRQGMQELAAQVASRARDPYSIVEEIARKIRIE